MAFKKKYWGCVVDHGESQLSFYLYAKKISRGPYLYLDLSEYKSVSDRSKRTFPDHNVSFFELISRWNNPDELFAAETDYLRSNNPENSKRYSLNVHLEPSFSTKAELCAYYMKTDLPKGNSPENYIKRLQQPFTRNIVN
ncbi:unnamed protein product [Didymodactylos carnosus]|uniref:Uncharacterized protein n=1 Tax=Didymodactylos carnosus TaxID=1234261 RepID=A0A8S2D200_9BILA|nr:unnamed protein product [Didymodactylos carnosus]CAF3576272.1 unnamed protein product [Didymodactylos carnosus]